MEAHELRNLLEEGELALGLTKREYVATQIAGAMMARNVDPDEVAEYAVKVADSLLSQLQASPAPMTSEAIKRHAEKVAQAVLGRRGG